MRKWHGKRILIGLLMTSMLMLPSCGKKEEATTSEPETIAPKEYIGKTGRNTIRISPDGNVLEISIEDYTSVNTNVEELKEYINTQIDEYNQKTGVNRVSFRELKQEGNVMKVAISYSDLETYADFNRMSISLSSYSSEKADEVARAEAERVKADERSTEAPDISQAELLEAGYEPGELPELQEASEQEEVKEIHEEFTDPSGKKIVSDQVPAGENMMLKTDERIAVELESGQILYTNHHAEIQDGTALTDGEGTAVIVLFLGI